MVKEKAKKIGGDESPTPPKENKVETSLRVTETAIEPMTVDPKALRERMAMETERRKVLTDYISANMVEGKDYGTISFTTRSGAQKESKPTLFKPGAEKFCSLFGLQATFVKDTETWEMLGSRPGVIAYVCRLATKSGSIVGEGRGVSDVNEKQGWTLNNAVKIAEKRAQIDAVLRSGGLSDFFTQDLEDMPQDQIDQRPPSYGASRPVAPGQQPYGKITRNQMNLVFKLLTDLNVTKEKFEAYLLKSYSVIGIENIPFELAKKVIDVLIKKSDTKKNKSQDLPTVRMDEEEEGRGGHVEDNTSGEDEWEKQLNR